MILVELTVAAGLLLGFSVYIGYPFLCFGSGMLAKTRPTRGSRKQKIPGDGSREKNGTAILPFVSIIISAKDEADHIERKIENTFALEYPGDRFEIIVGVNGSADSTEKTVAGFAKNGVRCFISKIPGKTRTQNLVVPESRGEVLFFTDADMLLEPDALLRLAEKFDDPAVGIVHGSIRFRGDRHQALYWDYEYTLKRLESESGRCLTALGGIMAVRRTVWRTLDPSIMEDFALPIAAVSDGYDSVFVQDALAYTDFYPDRAAWLESKRRIAAQDMFGYINSASSLLARKQWGLLVLLTLRKPLRWLGLVYVLPVQLGLVLLALDGGVMVLPGMAAVAVAVWGVFGIIAARPNPAASFYIMHAAALRGVIDCFTGRRISWWSRKGPDK